MKTPLGRKMFYTLSAEDVAEINATLPEEVDGRRRRNPVAEGQQYLAEVVGDHEEILTADLEVTIDSYKWWAPARRQDDLDQRGPGHWQSLVP